MEGKQEQISGMIHNHEVRGSFPRLATTDNQSLTKIQSM
jgi:hypothetical protein